MTARTSGVRAVAIVLAVACFGFGAMHAAWALGWRWGIPAGMASVPDRPGFLAYDVIAGLLILAAGVVSVGVWRRPALIAGSRGRIVVLVASTLSVVRGGLALVGDVISLIGGGQLTGVGVVADVWFTVAGVLGLVLWRGLVSVRPE